MKIPSEILNCKKDCRFIDQPGMTTLLGYTPIYNKEGEVDNKNPNERTGQYSCIKCNRIFSYHVNDDVTWEERK